MDAMKETKTDTNNNIKAKCLGSASWLNPCGSDHLWSFGNGLKNTKEEKKYCLPSKQPRICQKYEVKKTKPQRKSQLC